MILPICSVCQTLAVLGYRSEHAHVLFERCCCSLTCSLSCTALLMCSCACPSHMLFMCCSFAAHVWLMRFWLLQFRMLCTHLQRSARECKSMSPACVCRIKRRSEAEHQTIRDQLHIDCSGEDLPPPVTSFAAMRLPAATLKCLEQESITKPSPIQIQGLPAILSGRDTVGISYTGSGKTLVFALPLLMLALQVLPPPCEFCLLRHCLLRHSWMLLFLTGARFEGCKLMNAARVQDEWRMPLEQGEGPLGLIICPSRELARQTHAIIQTHVASLAADGWPELQCLLCVGGEDMKAAGDMIRRGVHMAVCTPGRLKDFLAKRRMNLDICRYLCLDEADRMVLPSCVSFSLVCCLPECSVGTSALMRPTAWCFPHVFRSLWSVAYPSVRPVLLP